MERNSPIGRRHPHGYAYVLLLFAVAVLGIAATASVELGRSMSQRDAEIELIAIGLEFQQALQSYAGVGGRGPRNMDELLRDPRFPGVRRHLRRIYADPLTGKSEWGLVTDELGSIVAVHSLSQGRPVRRDDFPPDLAGFERAESYRDWTFGLRRAAPDGSEARLRP